jgi:hypothetical protein
MIDGFQAVSAGLQSTGAFRKLVLPCQRVADDGLQIVKTRLPFERRADAVAGATMCAGSPGRRPVNSTLKSTPETRFTYRSPTAPKSHGRTHN